MNMNFMKEDYHTQLVLSTGHLNNPHYHLTQIKECGIFLLLITNNTAQKGGVCGNHTILKKQCAVLNP